MSPALEDCAGAIRLCCTYARDAAEHGRFASAHGLFQSALVFYDRAQKLVARENEFSFHDEREGNAWIEPLQFVRAEIDDCARYVYPENPLDRRVAPSQELGKPL